MFYPNNYTIPLPHNNIIIIGISYSDYSFISLCSNYNQLKLNCPACRSMELNPHGSYYKYYYNNPILILRLRCKKCRITHAIIPSFSLPNRSIGTSDLESYLNQLEKGDSKYKAGKIFKKLGVSENYHNLLYGSACKYFTRAKAFFPETSTLEKNGLSWIRSVIGDTDNLILNLTDKLQFYRSCNKY